MDNRYIKYKVINEMNCSEDIYDNYKEAYRNALNVEGILIGIKEDSEEELIKDFSCF